MLIRLPLGCGESGHLHMLKMLLDLKHCSLLLMPSIMLYEYCVLLFTNMPAIFNILLMGKLFSLCAFVVFPVQLIMELFLNLWETSKVN